MGIITQVGAGNATRIQQISKFLTGTTSFAGLTEVSEPGAYNTRWIGGFNSGWRFGWDSPAISTPHPVGVFRELEFSWVMKCKGEPSATASFDPFWNIDFDSSSFGEFFLGLVNKELVIRENFDGNTQVNVPTGILFQDELIVPITVRLRSQSGETAPGVSPADAAVEVWVNGDFLAYSTSGRTWGSLVTGELRTGFSTIFAQSHGINPILRDCVVRDDWSTADGVPPGIPHVIDRDVVALTPEGGTTWTNDAGGAIDFAEMNDTNDTTVVKTVDPLAHMVFEMAPLDVSVQSFPKVETSVTVRAGRDPLDPNDIDVVQVTDAGGLTEVGTPVNLPIVAANPLKDEVDTTIADSPDTLFLKVTNGA